MFKSEVGRKDDIVAWFFHVANDCCILDLNSCVLPVHNVCVGVILSLLLSGRRKGEEFPLFAQGLSTDQFPVTSSNACYEAGV